MAFTWQGLHVYWLCLLLLQGIACERSFTGYVRPPLSADLPLTHRRLAQSSASPHNPEQIHLAMAGAGAMAIDWVTNPQYDAELMRKHHGKSFCDRLADMKLSSSILYGINETALLSLGQGQYTCYVGDEYQSGALHHAILGTGADGPLQANTHYFYQVGDPSQDANSSDALSEIYSFKTPPEVGPNSFPYHLGLIGDLGQTENSMETLDHAAALQPDSILNVGDLSYADGYQPRWDSFGRLIQSSAARVPWQVIEGNHEEEVVKDELGFLAYNTRFHTQSASSGTSLYYSYEVAGLHVIMLGCYTDFDRHSKQYKWLKQDLAKVDRSRTPWLLVGMHAPWYNSNVAHQGEVESMRSSMETLLFENGVDAVFAGHVHAYERSFPVYQQQLNRLGPIYINIGDGGNREGLATEYIHPSPTWSAFREPSYGLGMLNVLNSSHAVWQWHRNQDGALTIGDEITLVRKGDSVIDRQLRQWCAYSPVLVIQVVGYLMQLIRPAGARMFT